VEYCFIQDSAVITTTPAYEYIAECVYIEAAAAGTLQSSNKLCYANHGVCLPGRAKKPFVIK
jgi:hypothetical protein